MEKAHLFVDVVLKSLFINNTKL